MCLMKWHTQRELPNKQVFFGKGARGSLLFTWFLASLFLESLWCFSGFFLTSLNYSLPLQKPLSSQGSSSIVMSSQASWQAWWSPQCSPVSTAAPSSVAVKRNTSILSRSTEDECDWLTSNLRKQESAIRINCAEWRRIRNKYWKYFIMVLKKLWSYFYGVCKLKRKAFKSE